ncbi:adenosylcobalamin-dependent ribonucleoside-diphosphate reductase [Rhodoligotrophos ferricapiens]|uniref:adenosylcobalamin-dependent ribonucleoside-diphosphate reductase n=1 Tax=Rhodoligotrophos ferricapiens TaxID=3069264 RepID=UPI00315D8502
MTELVRELSPIAHEIWDMKYRFKQPNGTPIDQTVDDTWWRVARALAAPERSDKREAYAAEFYEAMAGYRFLPAGRILAGAGTGRQVTLFNCFVMGTIADDMSGIFEGLREAALTMQQGGGIGNDFSTLRPHGAPVQGVGADASGPLSFMDVWDAMCRTIMSAGSRRGAMMATMRCDHPDIEAFIDVKRDPNRLRMFNLSVLVTDAFMEAVRDDSDWPLVFSGRVFKTVRARALWDKIMRATYDYAEPGVIFIDRVNALNNLQYCEQINATNPCGEQPLPPYGACLLGSINLARLVHDPFSGQARIDEDELGRLVTTAVRMMDNVVDVSNYPLEAQRKEALAKRRIGLGVTGLANALIMCGLRYGSEAAAARAKAWMGAIEHAAYAASVELAAEKGAFPLFDADAYLANGHASRLPKELRKRIAKHGIRNALLTSIAPTGTISLFADNISSGVEPVFSYTYQRRVLLPDGSHRTEPVSDYAYRMFRRLFGEEAALPEFFVTTQELSPRDHLVMEAALQAHVDSSISKTVNVPQEISFEAFRDVYQLAYDMGLKGCTTYRPNEITGSVLSIEQPAGSSPTPVVAATGASDSPMERASVLPGFTYKLKWPDSDHAIYITINDTMRDGRRVPFEIFINSKNMEHYAWTVALTRMISAVFRRGGDVSFVVEELKAVFDPRGGQWLKGRYVPSLLAAIGGVIEQHMLDIGFLSPEGRFIRGTDSSTEASSAQETSPVQHMTRAPAQCPRCGSATLVFQEGCATCMSCGYSRCG